MEVPTFGLLDAGDAVTRMAALGRLIEFWFGPRQPIYGEPTDRLNRLPLPAPLRCFYAHAGRWPSAEPEQQELFYTGGVGHHLRELDHVTQREDGRIDFFMEYQGDWEAVTLPDGEDPPVWLTGYQDEYEDDEERTVQVSDSLSKFLVTHCLMSILYEMENSVAKSGELVDYFDEHFRVPFLGEPQRLWDASCLQWPRSCLDYTGEFFLFASGVLVHRVSRQHRFAALRLPAVRTIVSRLSAR